MSLLARLAALERSRPSREPFCVLVMVCHDGTTAAVCWPLPDAHTDRLTLDAYRAQYGDQYRSLESWTVLADTEPIADRMCLHW